VARRPTRIKAARRLEKALTRRPLAAYLDLFKWLREHGPEGSYKSYADTNGQARSIVLAGRVKSESHTVGLERDVPVQYPSGEVRTEDVVHRCVPIALKENLRVEAA
jgi:hypothetical protein